jgi:heme/copper-type cytochrome/quinol oxidase subunit 2
MNTQTILVILAALAALLAIGIGRLSVPPKTSLKPTTVEFEMVTGEWKYESPDGSTVIEAYRWDPATLVVPRGSRVILKIFGVKGALHTLSIPAFGVSAVVKRGELTVVEFVADKAGIFPILCLNHPDIEHEGPMIGYLVVLE